MSDQQAGVRAYLRDCSALRMRRDDADLRADIRAERWSDRIAAANAAHFETIAMTAGQRIDRFLREPLGQETEDVIDLLRDLQGMFHDARARVAERRKAAPFGASEPDAGVTGQ